MRTALLVAFSLSFLSLPVSAQEAEGEHAAELDDAARVLFDDGTRAYDAGRFDEALDRYETAYELSQRPQLLYNIAVTHDRLDHKREAATFYERFVEALPDSPRAEVASSRAEILRRSANAQDAEVAAAREAAERAEQEAAAAREAVRRPPPEPTPEASRSLAGPIASFAVGGAGLVTWAVAGLITMSKHGDCDAEDAACTTDELDAIDRSALIADIGLGVAIAGVATGVIWLLVGGDDEDEATTQVMPAIGADRAGLLVRSQF